ncbi:DUF3618 domain-containing protein [bacterium]|nr:DUF3618 domain-containing protein [bacterium]
MTQTPQYNRSESDLDRANSTPVSGMPPQESIHRRDVRSTPSYIPPAENEDDPRAIRRNIERTRAEMGETIDRIQDRLNPDRLRSEAEEAVREATIGRIETMAYDAKRKAKRAQRNVMETVKENPIPAALIGVGIGWLIMSNNNDDADYNDDNDDYYYSGYGRPYPSNYRYYEDPYYEYEIAERQGTMQPQAYAEYDRRYAETPSPRRRTNGGWDDEGSRTEEWRRQGNEAADNVREGAQNAARRTQEEVDNMRHRVREGAGELSEEMQRRAEEMRYQMRRRQRQTRRQFNQAMDSNPLAVGALTLAAGALIGLMIPNTEMENEWMGEERDHLMREARQQAQSRAEQTMNKVQNVVEEATDAAKDAAKETTERTKSEAERQNLTTSSSR